MTNKLLLAALAASAAVLPATAQAQRVSGAIVAVVDSQRVYTECTACRAAVTQLQSQQTTARTRAQTLQTQLQTEGQPIQQAVNALNGREPDAALRQRITAFQTKENAARQELATLERNLQSTQLNVRQQIDQRLSGIYNQVMTARGANLLVDEQATLAHAAGLDVTNDVLARLNQVLPSVSVTPLPQQQQQQTPQGR